MISTDRGAPARRSTRGGGRADALLRLVPTLFLIPVAAGLGISFVRLIGTAHPLYGWTMSINADAEAMYLGTWPFQDPAHGFTGDAYTPLYPALVSILNHLRFWTGWSVVVTLLSVAGLGALIARLAYREPRQRTVGWRVLACLEAAGIGALAVSFAFGLLWPSVYEARPDHFALLLAFSGVALVPRAATGSWRARVFVVLLLTAAFWAKQTAILGWVSAALVVLLLVWSGRMAARIALAWLAGLIALNAVILAVLSALTGGWQYRFNFTIHLPVTRSVADVAPDLAERALPATAFVALGCLAAWLAAGSPPRRALRAWLARASDRTFLALGFGFMAVVGAVAAVYLRRFAAGEDNNLLPCLWALAAVGAIAYRRAGQARNGVVLAALGCLIIFSTTFVSREGAWRLRGGHVVPDQHWRELPREVDRLASRTLLWDPYLSDLNVAHQGVIFPNIVHIQEALLRDRRPRTLERALLGRRFGAVYGRVVAQDFGRYQGVSWEDNYFWKLGVVVDQKYRPAPELPRLPTPAPDGSLVPTEASAPVPGPDPAPWLDACFGPFRLAGTTMQIHRGGGLWCVPAPDVLELRATPAPVTEVVSGPVAEVRGRFTARINPVPGSWTVAHDGHWSLRGSVTPGATGLTVRLVDKSGRLAGRVVVGRDALHATGGRIGVALVPGASLSLAPSHGAGVVVAGAGSDRGSGGRLHFWATRLSGARFDLRQLRVRSTGGA